VESWAQQENEPNIWHQRFTSYRLMGHQRSLLGCYREEKARSSLKKLDRAKAIPGAWREASKRWQWEERARDWDLGQARSTEEVVKSARSSQTQKQVALEGEWLDREARLRAKAYEWMEHYLFDRVKEIKITEKEGLSSEGEMISEKTTTTTQKLPPQWMIERFIGRRDYATQFNVLMDLLKSIMAIEGTSEDLQQIKGMIQASLEGLLLESGVDEVRTLLSRGG